MTSMTIFNSSIHLNSISYNHPSSFQIASYKTSYSSSYNSSSSLLQSYHPNLIILTLLFLLNELVYFKVPESIIQSCLP